MYTYDDFVTAARNAGMLDRFSEEDLRIAQSSPEYGLSALKLNQDLQNATTMEQQLLAQEAMKQLRQSYGVTGMQSSQPGTQTVYQQALNEAAPAAGSFLYDPATDPSYGAQKKAYLREGDRARADTMAQVSAATGGVPSSYAVTAAQQAGDYYSTQWADKVPGLEQTAYQKYLQELGIQKEAADLMAAKGDYSLLGKYYGLTDEQLALLQKRSGGNVPTAPGTVPDTMLQTVMNTYPGGKVTNEGFWNNLVALYGEEALAAAGITYGKQEASAAEGKPGLPGSGPAMHHYVKD